MSTESKESKFLEALKKVKQIFKDISGGSEDTQPLTVTAEDGSTLQIEGGELKAGAKVSIVASDGTTQPAPDGEIKLNDGSSIIVANGAITAVESAAEEGAEGGAGGDAATMESMAAQIGDHENRIKSMEDTLKKSDTAMKAQEQVIADQKKTIDSLTQKFSAAMELNGSVIEALDAMSKSAATEPTEKKKGLFGSEEKVQKQDETVKKLADSFKQLRDNKRY